MHLCAHILIVIFTLSSLAFPVLALATERSSAPSFSIGNPRLAPFYSGEPEIRRTLPSNDNFLHNYLRNTAERTFTDADLIMLSEHFYGFEKYSVSPGYLAAEGAGAGATLGLFGGAVATTTGLWDEREAWYLVGAATAVGALFGLRRASDPKERTRYRWSIGSGK